MKIKLVAVGQKMPRWVEEAFGDYQKRLPKDFSLELIEVVPAQRPKNYSIEQVMKKEAQAIAARLTGKEWLVALEVKGKAWSTEQLAQASEQWKYTGQDVALIVGGPDGLDPELSAKADQKWSLSNLTLPHPLVRVLLAEQLYRAWSIQVGHPYHK